MKNELEIIPIVVDKKTSKDLMSSGWSFDWSLLGAADSLKISVVSENKQIEGLVDYHGEPASLCNRIFWIEIAPHNRGENKKFEGVAGILLAVVARDSIARGFDGFVVLQSKTNLKPHYIKKYGGKQIGNSDEIYFDTEASIKLINTYLKGKEKVL